MLHCLIFFFIINSILIVDWIVVGLSRKLGCQLTRNSTDFISGPAKDKSSAPGLVNHKKLLCCGLTPIIELCSIVWKQIHQLTVVTRFSVDIAHWGFPYCRRVSISIILLQHLDTNSETNAFSVGWIHVASIEHLYIQTIRKTVWILHCLKILYYRTNRELSNKWHIVYFWKFILKYINNWKMIRTLKIPYLNSYDNWIPQYYYARREVLILGSCYNYD